MCTNAGIILTCVNRIIAATQLTKDNTSSFSGLWITLRSNPVVLPYHKFLPLLAFNYLLYKPNIIAHIMLQAMLDLVADAGWLCTTLQVIQVIQMLIQGRWNTDSSFLTIPHVEQAHLPAFRQVTVVPFEQYPTMQYFGISRYAHQPMIEIKNLNGFFREFPFISAQWEYCLHAV